MRETRGAGMELVRALCVLALLFLNFAHAPIAAQPGNSDILTAAISADFCGGMPDSDGGAHAPCHACRIGGAADLPPPVATLACPASVALVVFGASVVRQAPGAPPRPYGARAPPVA